MAELLSILHKLIASAVIFFSLISQFFTHPVIFNLMNDKWLGKFGRMERCSWLSLQGLLWILLHIWCLFDLVMFPFLFAVFYVKHCRNKNKLEDKGMKRKIHKLNQVYFSTRGLSENMFVLCFCCLRPSVVEVRNNISFISFADCFKF